MSLEEKFQEIVRITPTIPLPAHCLNISDIHAGAGDNHDPLRAGAEMLVIDTLLDFQARGYALLGSEFFDVWRGEDLVSVYTAHPALLDAIRAFGDKLYWVLGNHERNLLTLPIACVFEGFGRKIFLDHGWLYDWPNCEGWKIGRAAVRMADLLGIDPESSPHPDNIERHLLVRDARQQLADAHPDWDFFWGHTHYWEDKGNNHNSGVGHHSPLLGFTIEEGEIARLERR